MKSYEELLEEALEKIPKKVDIDTRRFRMPTVSIAYRGSKTVIRNLKEILDVLRRKEKHFVKYVLREVGIAGQVIGNELILNGIVRKETLQRKLEQYVKEFVICDVCGSADTILEKEGKVTFLRCEACGARRIVREI